MLTKIVQVAGYKILETSTIRTQDIKRFMVEKPGAKTPYIVTFQGGHQYGCSCPAGRNQKHCKHVNMCLNLH